MTGATLTREDYDRLLKAGLDLFAAMNEIESLGEEVLDACPDQALMLIADGAFGFALDLRGFARPRRCR